MRRHAPIRSVRNPAWRDGFKRRARAVRERTLTQKRGPEEDSYCRPTPTPLEDMSRDQFFALKKHTPGRSPSRRRAEALADQLADAAWDGDTDRLTGLLALGASPNETRAQDPFIAAVDGCTPEVDSCLERLLGAVNLRRRVRDGRQVDGGSLLHAAAEYRNKVLLRAALPFCDLRERDEDGDTPLMAALQNEESSASECALALLPGSDAGARDRYGRTPLMLAARCGLPDCVKALLPASDPLAADSDGLTALMHAVPVDGVYPNENGMVECIRALLPASDTRAQDRKGRTAAVLVASQDKTSWQWRQPATRHALTLAADLIATNSPRDIAEEAYAIAGSDGMPQWAAMREAEAIAEACNGGRAASGAGASQDAAPRTIVARKRPRSL